MGAEQVRTAANLLRDSDLQWGDEMCIELHKLADEVARYIERIDADG
jgi:hypothetical protein